MLNVKHFNYKSEIYLNILKFYKILFLNYFKFCTNFRKYFSKAADK